MADQLATIAQVKARLFPAGVADTSDDAMLTEIVEEVTAWMQGYMGRRIVAQAGATMYFDTVAGTTLVIVPGIRAVTSLSIAQTHQPDTGGTYTAVASGTILLRPKAQDLPQGWPFLEIRLSRATSTTFANAENGAKIVGDFGWAATPPDLEAVCIEATVAAYQSRKDGVQVVMGPDGIPVYPGNRQRQWAGTLVRYATHGL